MTCSVCGGSQVLAKDRCRACYRWLRKHKRDRTEAEVATLNLRRFEARMERQVLRQMGRIRTT